MEIHKGKLKNVARFFLLSVVIFVASLTLNVYAEEPDTTPPKIENVVFEQKGQTLNNGDTFSIKIFTVDEGSGVSTVDVMTGSEGQAVGAGHGCIYNEEEGCYIFSEIIHDSYVDNIYVSEIKVTDNAGNYTHLSVHENTLSKLEYCAKINPLAMPNLDLDFIFEKNGKTVSSIDDLGVSIETKDIIPSDNIQLIFQGSENRLVLHLYRNESTPRLYNDKIVYAWESSEPDAKNEGKWDLERITALVGFPLNELTFNVQAENYSFTLDKNHVEPTLPAIKFVNLDKNGENVQVGDKINIIIDVDNTQDILNSGQLTLHADADIEDCTKTIELIYDETEKKYHGTFDITEDVYACKWYIEKINICDKNGNYADDSSYTSASGYPYYVNVSEAVVIPPTEDKIVDIIKKWSSGSICPIDMDNMTIITKKILESIKGKNITVVFKMNGYEWTISSRSIASDNLQDINMEVILDTNNIPSLIIKEKAGNNPIRQLTLKHEGLFGFTGTLTVNVGKQYFGKYGNLFYYDKTGKLKFMDAGKILENGDVNLIFNHASDYVIVMSDEIMSDDADNGSDSPEDSSGSSGNSGSQDDSKKSDKNKTNTSSVENNESNNGISSNLNTTDTNVSETNLSNTISPSNKSVQTGDESPIMFWVLCTIIIISGLIVGRKKYII